jgi:hypothetical protein
MIELTIYNEELTKSYTIRPFHRDDSLWIKTETGEGMPITYEELYKWIDKGYQEKF